MQREIKEAYQHQQQQQHHRQCLSTVLKSPQKSPKGKAPRKQSPQNKGRSPGRSPGKHSPQFKVPRGRPGRGRPRKLEFRQKGQPTIFSAVSGKQVLLHVIMHCCSLFIQFLKNEIFFLGLLIYVLWNHAYLGSQCSWIIKILLVCGDENSWVR